MLLLAANVGVPIGTMSLSFLPVVNDLMQGLKEPTSTAGFCRFAVLQGKNNLVCYRIKSFKPFGIWYNNSVRTFLVAESELPLNNEKKFMPFLPYWPYHQKSVLFCGLQNNYQENFIQHS